MHTTRGKITVVKSPLGTRQTNLISVQRSDGVFLLETD